MGKLVQKYWRCLTCKFWQVQETHCFPPMLRTLLPLRGWHASKDLGRRPKSGRTHLIPAMGGKEETQDYVVDVKSEA
eukprot:1568730-Amphidinium_carterae.1